MSDTTESSNDSLTIVIHLPQPIDRVTALLVAIAEQWPDAAFTDGLARLEIPVDE